MFVKLWMTKDPLVVTREQTINEADALMRQHNVRRLPVVDADNTLVGIITRQDLMKAMLFDSSQDMFIGEDVPVAGFMTASPITVDPMEPLESATDIMRKNRIGGLPVVSKDGALVGILTESDICRAVIDIFAAGVDGARIELQIGRNAAELYEIFRILKDFDMQVKSVSLFAGFSETSQLLTVRVQGEEMEKMLDALWKSGAKVHRVMVDDTDG